MGPWSLTGAASERADLGLVGEVDMGSIDLFRRTLADVMTERHRRELTIDARDLTFVDHRGLFAVAEAAGGHCATIVVRTRSSTSKRLVELLDLDAVRVEVTV